VSPSQPPVTFHLIPITFPRLIALWSDRAIPDLTYEVLLDGLRPQACSLSPWNNGFSNRSGRVAWWTLLHLMRRNRPISRLLGLFNFVILTDAQLVNPQSDSTRLLSKVQKCTLNTLCNMADSIHPTEPKLLLLSIPRLMTPFCAQKQYRALS
jgi:hypothetical protein